MNWIAIVLLVALTPLAALAQDPTEVGVKVVEMFGFTGTTGTLVTLGIGVLVMVCAGLSAAFGDSKLGKVAGAINLFAMNFGKAKNNPADQ